MSPAGHTATDSPSPNSDAMLRISGVTKVYTKRTLFDRVGRRGGVRIVALDDVSLSVPRGGAVGLVGESGSGKTTLARTIVRLVEPDSGAVVFDGVDLLSLKGAALAAARRRVQLIYQDPYSSLNPALTVGGAIAEPALVHGLVEARSARGRVHELMSQVGLSEKLEDRRPRDLSGGQRQRVAIARALAAEPELLIADEAVSALDVSIQAQVLALLARLTSELHLTLLFVSHQLATVEHICEWVAVMYRGRIVEEGPTREVFRTPRHAYTLALLNAHPGRGSQPAGRRGAPAAVDTQPGGTQGCPFADRCDFRVGECTETMPPVMLLGEGRATRCVVLPKLSAREVQARLVWDGGDVLRG